MAYVRVKGNQLAVVHGARDPETRKVQQETLFTLYSQAEVKAATGDQSRSFRSILKDRHPQIRFDWAKIDAGLKDNLEHLPETYEGRLASAESDFDDALVAFTRELSVHDPQTFISSARMLAARREALRFLKDLIEWRLRLCEQAENEWNRDHPFLWRQAMWRSQAPTALWERLEQLLDHGEYDTLDALADLFTRCWPNFARAHNYRGLGALRQDQLEAALGHFDAAIDVARANLPRRVRKNQWWSDHDTRPYIRGIINKLTTLNRMGAHEEALALCDRLEEECQQDLFAADLRSAVALNAGDFATAAAAAQQVADVYPSAHLLVGLARRELGDIQAADLAFIRGAIRYGRTARILFGLRRHQPRGYFATADHNNGVKLSRDIDGYLNRMTRAHRRHWIALLKQPALIEVQNEYESVKDRRSTDTEDASPAAFQRALEMETQAFARKVAAELARG